MSVFGTVFGNVFGNVFGGIGSGTGSGSSGGSGVTENVFGTVFGNFFGTVFGGFGAAPSVGSTTGIWVSYGYAMRKPAFRREVWALHNQSLHFATNVIKRIRAEAQGAHTWARYAPGAPRNTGALQVDVKAAIAAHLTLS